MTSSGTKIKYSEERSERIQTQSINHFMCATITLVYKHINSPFKEQSIHAKDFAFSTDRIFILDESGPIYVQFKDLESWKVESTNAPSLTH